MGRRREAKDPHVEAQLAAYEDIEVIGKGSFGLIRKVRRHADGLLFARKELDYNRMSDRDRKQIVAEVNILRQLNHQNIVRYVERINDVDASCLHLVMEYCQNGDLGSVIKNCRRDGKFLREDVVWSYLAQMTRALDACHNGMPMAAEAGKGSTPPILHRDLKPENVFLDANDNVKLGDFGLSKQITGSHTFASTYVGTPYYMSPELATGASYDTKSDIWALGCIVYELCALRPPFDATSQAELTIKIKSGQVPSLPRRYSRELDEVVRSTLQLQPKRRPTTSEILELPRILFATQTVDLQALRDALAKEQAQVEVDKQRLAQWEQDLARRQSEWETRRNAELESQWGQRCAQEDDQLKRERESFEAQAATLAQEWDRRTNEWLSEKARLVEDRAEFEREKAAWAAGRDAQGQQSVSRPPRVQSAAAFKRVGESSSTRASPARAGSRPSLGQRRISASGDVSMEGPSSRAIKMTVTGKLTEARRRRSSVLRAEREDGWYDANGESSSEGAKEGVESAEVRTAPSVLRRSSDAQANVGSTVGARRISRPGPDETAEVVSRPAAAGGVARLLNREKSAGLADRSDISMRDVTTAEADKENEAGGLSSPEPFTKAFRKGSIVQRARRLTLEQQQRQQQRDEQRDAGASEEAANAGQTTAVVPRTTSAPVVRQRPQAASSLRPVYNVEQPPVYDLSNDADLPSPFLRKPAVSLPQSVLQKARSSAALSGKGAVLSSKSSSSNLFSKAAVARSSQQLHHALLDDTSEAAVGGAHAAHRPSLSRVGGPSSSSASTTSVLRARRSLFAMAPATGSGLPARTRPSAPAKSDVASTPTAPLPPSSSLATTSLARRPRSSLASGHRGSSANPVSLTAEGPDAAPSAGIFSQAQGMGPRSKSYTTSRLAPRPPSAPQLPPSLAKGRTALVVAE
ncbi:unnamed protein product [Parajaminaea phylloscopi]